ncbi:MAG TPA: hypothetical protein VFU06_16845 [Longimicrobiales bacterium]|nr:hypothetical protein [Longimicrobiales bacterium]
MRRSKLVQAPICTLAGILLLPGTSMAQSVAAVDGPAFGVGYAANAPELLAGAAAWFVVPALGGIGLYADAKFDVDSPARGDTYEADLTAAEVDSELGDEYRDSEGSWRSFNIAVVRPVTPSLMLYAGGGYARETMYRQYVDATGSRGLGGVYWVRSPDENGSSVNFLAGMFLRLGRHLNAQFGLDSAPRGFGVGMSLVFD